MSALTYDVAPCLNGMIVDREMASLYDEARHEAERHKWIESERHGHDLGDYAIRQWYQQHWLKYCRMRRLEHLRGMRRWREFDDQAFGCLYTLIVRGDLLLDRILDRMDSGYENLCIINWAFEWGLNMERVLTHPTPDRCQPFSPGTGLLSLEMVLHHTGAARSKGDLQASAAD